MASSLSERQTRIGRSSLSENAGHPRTGTRFRSQISGGPARAPGCDPFVTCTYSGSAECSTKASTKARSRGASSPVIRNSCETRTAVALAQWGTLSENARRGLAVSNMIFPSRPRDRLDVTALSLTPPAAESPPMFLVPSKAGRSDPSKWTDHSYFCSKPLRSSTAPRADNRRSCGGLSLRAAAIVASSAASAKGRILG
jgi:hypothetical protein